MRATAYGQDRIVDSRHYEGLDVAVLALPLLWPLRLSVRIGALQMIQSAGKSRKYYSKTTEVHR